MNEKLNSTNCMVTTKNVALLQIDNFLYDKKKKKKKKKRKKKRKKERKEKKRKEAVL
jgi:hypothetical protein